jgi:hypothetical protein
VREDFVASVRNVRLEVEKGGEGSRRTVTVTWENCFARCEALAGSVFVETVTLRGDDLLFDDHLTTLSRRCVRADAAGCDDRSIRRRVSRSTLDEDGDTVIFGIPIHADRDELYARVSLEPYEPSGDRSDSNLVYGQFGAAGSD